MIFFTATPSDTGRKNLSKKIRLHLFRKMNYTKLMINSLFILFSLFVSISGFAQDITINVDGKKLTVISLEEIKQLKIDEVEFFNKVTLRAERYKGVPTMRLIEKFYPETQNLVEFEFISGTDFNPLVDIELLRRTNSILAFERSDGDKFVRYSKKEKILVPLGPLYLVWALKQVSKEDRLLHTCHTQPSTRKSYSIYLVIKVLANAFA